MLTAEVRSFVDFFAGKFPRPESDTWQPGAWCHAGQLALPALLPERRKPLIIRVERSTARLIFI
jgi:hypothetical protein